MWTVFEPVHAVAYFAADMRAAFESAGVRGFWRFYFASRAAPLGASAPTVAQATFFGFAPSMVTRAIPSVWALIEPATAWRLRSTTAAGVLRSSDALPDDATLRRLNELLAEVVGRLDPAGRVLFAAHAALDWPDDPAERLWHACTLLREHRGDGYTASAVSEGAGPLDVLVIADRLSLAPRGHALDNRGWTPDEWEVAVGDLQRRGVLDDDGRLTAAGVAVRNRIEARTDRAAGSPWQTLGDDDLTFAFETLRHVTTRVVAAGLLTYPNAVGVPPPS